MGVVIFTSLGRICKDHVAILHGDWWLSLSGASSLDVWILQAIFYVTTESVCLPLLLAHKGYSCPTCLMPMSALSSGSVSHLSHVLWLLISSLMFNIVSMALWDGGSLSTVVLRCLKFLLHVFVQYYVRFSYNFSLLLKLWALFLLSGHVCCCVGQVSPWLWQMPAMEEGGRSHFPQLPGL